MLLKYFYDDKLAQASYMVGCAATGEALVIDPSRDITPYLKVAEQEGLRITHVTETHIHADYVSGTRELAAHTGATKYLSDEGDENWKYGYVDDNTVLMKDGYTWMVGNIKIEAIHTPGHTPEHMTYQITDTAGADKPIGLFTGDFLFVGDIGRPDLLDEAAGFVGTREVGARQQFANIQKFKNMPGYLQVWPGHGAGSACGKALGAIPSTTLGYEKLFNPAFQHSNEQDFVDWLLDGQPEAPFYFAQMKKVNKIGPALLSELEKPQHFNANTFDAVLNSNAQIFDTRSSEQFVRSFVPGTMNVPLDSGFTTFAGWLVDFDKPLYLITDTHNVNSVITLLRAIGVDNIKGYFSTDVVAQYNETLAQIDTLQLGDAMASGARLIDVRGKKDYQELHIPNADHVPLGYLKRELVDLDRSTPIITQCTSGVTSVVAASVLRSLGFTDVTNFEGGINAWREAQTLVVNN